MLFNKIPVIDIGRLCDSAITCFIKMSTYPEFRTLFRDSVLQRPAVGND